MSTLKIRFRPRNAFVVRELRVVVVGQSCLEVVDQPHYVCPLVLPARPGGFCVVHPRPREARPLTGRDECLRCDLYLRQPTLEYPDVRRHFGPTMCGLTNA